MSKNGNLEKNIKKTVDILISLNEIPSSTKNLCYGIEWLLVDKFVKDKGLRNLLLDMLGDKMSALYEYVQRKEQKGREEGRESERKVLIKKLYDAGMSIKEISKITEIFFEKCL